MVEYKKLVHLVDKILHWENGVALGEVLADVDGYYKFFPAHRDGCYWDETMLFSIAYTLQEMNEPWDKQIAEYFDEHPNG